MRKEANKTKVLPTQVDSRNGSLSVRDKIQIDSFEDFRSSSRKDHLIPYREVTYFILARSSHFW